MKILLLSATQQEIDPFLKQKVHMDVVIGGIGVAATTYHLTKQLLHHHYDLVIQAGVAGLFQDSDPNLALGNVVAVAKDTFGDLGAWEKEGFKSPADMNLNNGLEWFYNKTPLLGKLKYPKVAAITINTITDNKEKINALQQRWQPQVESMEGAALHYVCTEKQVPYIQLRAISNHVGERNKEKWEMGIAINNLNHELQSVIHEFSH